MAGSGELLKKLGSFRYNEKSSSYSRDAVKRVRSKPAIPSRSSVVKDDTKLHAVYNLPSLVPSLKPGLKVVFIGFNPGIESSRLQQHYAHKSNRFWPMFNKCRILSKVTKGEVNKQCFARDDYDLLNYNIGFTDLVLRPTKSAAELPLSEMISNVPRLTAELDTNRPKVACFVGKGIWEKVLSYNKVKDKIKTFEWGQQPKDLNELINLSKDVTIFVIPSTSGLVSISHEFQRQLWLDLADIL